MRKLWIIWVFLFLAGCSSSSDEAPVPQEETDSGPTIAEDLQPISILINADRPLIGIVQENSSIFGINSSNIETVADESKNLNSLITPAYLGTEPPTNFTNPDSEGEIDLDVVLGTDEFSIDLAISATLPLGATASCFGLNSWQGIITEQICSTALNSFIINFTSSQIQKEELRVNIYSTNGDPDDFLVSTAIASHRIRFKQISDLNTIGDDGIQETFDFGGSLYFVSDYTGSEKMYKFESGLFSQVSNLVSGDDQLRGIAKGDTALYFQGDSILGDKIFAYSGVTGSGIKQVSNLNGFGGDSLMSQMGTLGDKLYFVSDQNPSGEDRLMFYDGSIIDSIDFDLYDTGVDEISYLAAVDNTVYYQALDSGGHKKLWRYDPNFNNGIGRVEKMTGLYDGFDDDIRDIKALNNFIYFIGKNSIGNEKLFKLDPALKSSKQLSSTNIVGTDNINEFQILDSKIYLSARNTAGQQKPFMYDPSEGLFFQMTDFYAGDENPSGFTSYGGFVYFVAQINSDGHRKMFLFDIDSSTIVQVTDINQNASDDVDNLVIINSVLYFTAKSNGEQKLFRLCDESTGCIN